jgi:ribosome-binding protein aMBF1 (putative translation factor)
MQEFKKVIKEKLEKKGITISKLAMEIRVRDLLIREVISGRKTSRPLVLKMADYFQDPELLYIYEKELQERKSNKSKKEV